MRSALLFRNAGAFFLSLLSCIFLVAIRAEADVIELVRDLQAGNGTVVDRDGAVLPRRTADYVNGKGGLNVDLARARQFDSGARIGKSGFVAFPPADKQNFTRIELTVAPASAGAYYFTSNIGLAQYDPEPQDFEQQVTARFYLQGDGDAPVDKAGRILLRKAYFPRRIARNIAVPLGFFEAGEAKKFTIEVQLSPQQDKASWAGLLFDEPLIEHLPSLMISQRDSAPGNALVMPDPTQPTGKVFSRSWLPSSSGEYPGRNTIILDGTATTEATARFFVDLQTLQRSLQYSLFATVDSAYPDRCSGQTNVRIRIGGDVYNNAEPALYDLTEFELGADNARPVLSKPIGIISKRKHAFLQIEVSSPTAPCRAVQFGAPLLYAKSAATKLGFAFGRLFWGRSDGLEIFRARAEAGKQIGTKLFRTGIVTPDVLSQFSQGILAANENDIDVLLGFTLRTYELKRNADGTVVEPADHPNCQGIDVGISQVDPVLFLSRLEANLKALKENERLHPGVARPLKYFEAGNEMNMECFNGDIPSGWRPDPNNPADMEIVRARARDYARLVAQAVPLVRRYYPNVTVLSVGAAYLAGENVGGIPADMFFETLRNLDGHDYVHELFDAVSLHVYPRLGWTAGKFDPTANFDLARRHVSGVASVVGGRMPIWITELGFRRDRFVTGQGDKRALRYPTEVGIIQELSTLPNVDLQGVTYFGLDSPEDLENVHTESVWYNWGHLRVVETPGMLNGREVFFYPIKGIFPEAYIPAHYGAR